MKIINRKTALEALRFEYNVSDKLQAKIIINELCDYMEEKINSIEYKFDKYVDYTTDGKCSKSFLELDELKDAFDKNCESLGW